MQNYLVHVLQTFTDRMLAEESTNWLKNVAYGDAHAEMYFFKQNGLSLTRSSQWHCQLVWIRLPELVFFSGFTSSANA